MAFVVPDVPAGPDLDEVRKALAVLAPPGTFEIRALPSGKSWIGRDVMAAAEAVSGMASGTGVYYTLNPVRPDLAKAATNKDVVERSHLLVDVDSVRPDANLPATEAEKMEAGELTDEVEGYLRSEGCPDPVAVDSGNGFQLVYRVDLPNNDLGHKVVSSFLRQLAARFDRTGARIDPSVHNAGRIARLPGTWNRKGLSSPVRPHRMARLWSVPKKIEAVPVDVLRRLAGMADGDAEPAAPPPRLAVWTVPVVSNGEAVAWFRRAKENEIAQAMLAPQGDRHNALRAAARTLAGYLHFGVFTEAELARDLYTAGERSGLDEKDRRDVIRWGLENGKANPLPWPDRLTRPAAAHGVNGTAAAETVGGSGRSYAFPLIVRGSAVNPKKVRWLWPDRVPFGFLTLMAGRTGVGKSFVILDVAARVTVGEEIPFYGGECFDPGAVLVIGEDSHEYVLAPRLIEAGADMNRVAFMSWEAMASFTLSDVQMIDDVYLAAGSPVLVVIDPPTNFLGAKDEHKNAEVRSTLMGVSIWAMRHDLACVMITHCNKGVKKDMAALDRIIGSVAWASTSRIAHILAPDPDDRKRGVFIPMKSNIGEMPAGLAYAIEKTETLAKVRWVGPIDFDADDALSGEKKKPRGVVAVEWLAEVFRNQREWPSDELIRAGREAGVSRSALFSPEVAALPVRKHQVVGADGNRRWYWTAEAGWPPAIENGRDSETVKFCERKPKEDNTNNRVPMGQGGRDCESMGQSSRISEFQGVSSETVGTEGVGRAARWLVRLLNTCISMPADEVLRYGVEVGLSEAVLREALKSDPVFVEEVKGGVAHWSYQEAF